MFLTEPSFREKMTGCDQGKVLSFLPRFHGLEQMDGVEEKDEGQLPMQGKNRIGEIKRIKSVHMQGVKEKVTFYLTAAAYLLFNLRPAADLAVTVQSTLWQILQTALCGRHHLVYHRPAAIHVRGRKGVLGTPLSLVFYHRNFCRSCPCNY